MSALKIYPDRNLHSAILRLAYLAGELKCRGQNKHGVCGRINHKPNKLDDLKYTTFLSSSWSAYTIGHYEEPLTTWLLKKHNFPTRDAKGRKVSGNFGNFPWKVSGILKEWEFLGIFNFDLLSTFYEIVCTKINRTEFFQHYIQKHLFCTTFLTVYWFVWVHRKNHKALLWNNIRSNLLSFYI